MLKDKLTGALIGLARATDGSEHLISESATALILDALAATGGEPSDAALEALLARVDEEKRKMVPDCFQCACPCGRSSPFDMAQLQTADEETRAMKLRLLQIIRTLAAENRRGSKLDSLYYQALIVIGMEDFRGSRLAAFLEELEHI